MLDITGDDIAELNDEDLRSMVGRLCESELRFFGLPTSAVTYGGNQTAVDGGIDVRVKIESGQGPGDFVPRNNVGFQVKKTNYTPTLIGGEMCPKGELRPSIRDLIKERGAYIIASSGSKTSDSVWRRRIKAMRTAVADAIGHENLYLDFYDRNRLATWVRNHAGIVLWVRQIIGRSIPGWQPYSGWARSPEGISDEYLQDSKARLYTGVSDIRGIDVIEGIDRIRAILRESRSVVRLVGLSGVGKTRLVQALFDERMGSNPLNPELAIYTDMSDNPSPQPMGMISDLIADQRRAIVVVDNCAPDLHRRITEVCRGDISTVSVITVEYDVRDDEPEGTEVFRLEPSSEDVISQLIARRFPTMTQADTDWIAKFSGGNARIALALAGTVERGESVAGLRDEELFRRLFHQRQTPDDSLLQAAQACALLYSFQGEALSGDEAELPKLASLVGMNTQQLFAKIAHLQQRDLVQRRSVWRAILPHAIANRLAAMALQEIPFEIIERQFNTVRLLRSFSRRLGYLHESKEAQRIAEQWLEKGGLFANVGRLSEDGLAMFENIAPVSPETALTTIEAELSGTDAEGLLKGESRRERIARILQAIAYEAHLFDRSLTAMISLALAERSDARTHRIKDEMKGLFQICLSGTHATVEQRTRVVHGLLSSHQPDRRALGLQLLDSLLQTDHFSGNHLTDFGARNRDYGYEPSSREECAPWFVATLQMTRRFASRADDIASTIQSMLAESVRELWFLGPEIQLIFETIAQEIAVDGYWHDGWIAVRYLLSHLGHEEKKDSVSIERLRNFEYALRPKNLVEQVRAVVLSERSGSIDYAEMDVEPGTEYGTLTSAREKAFAEAEELGKAVCENLSAFVTLLPELVKGNAPRLFAFGKGLSLAAVDHRNLWDQFADAIANTEESQCNVTVAMGFLAGLTEMDEQLREVLLEEAVVHETLGQWFPALQSQVEITSAGIDRLDQAAKLGKAHPQAFRYLGWHRSFDTANSDGLRTIILSLAKRQQGYGVAVDILAMRLHPKPNETNQRPSELIDAGRELLSSPDFSARGNSFDYHLHTIADVCLAGTEGSIAAQSLCERIRQGVINHTFSAYTYGQVVASIFKLQPRIALDVFYGDVLDASSHEIIRLSGLSDHRKNPLNDVPFEVLIEWCDEMPGVRYPVMARVVSFDRSTNEGGVEWTPFAREMVRRAPNPLAVLEAFVDRFHPRSGSGSLTAIVESRLSLLDQLGDLNNKAIQEYVLQIRPKLVEDVAQWRKWEEQRDREQDERFE
jgi:hypothetical protein